MFHEYPKSLYLRGWSDLSATVVVHDAAAEAEARAAGYRMLSDPEPVANAVAASDSMEAEVVPAAEIVPPEPEPRRRRS
jgi:hypothetical protein